MRSKNLIYLTIALIIGIILGNLDIITLMMPLIVIGLAIGSYILGIRIKKKNPFSKSQFYLNETSVLLLFFGIGTFSAINQRPSLKEFESAEYIFKGKVLDFNATNYGDKVLIELQNLYKLESGTARAENVRNVNALITIAGAGTVNYGDVISGQAKLNPIDIKGNFLKDDYEEYLRRKHIFLTGYSDEGNAVVTHSYSFPMSVMQKWRYELEVLFEKTSLASPTKGFLISILLGDKSYIKSDERIMFSDAGIAHIFAVSGFHVSLVGAFVLAILSIFFRNSKRHWKFLICLPLIWFYILLVGCSPSSCRAGIMLTIAFMALFFQRKYNALTGLLWAVLLILIFSPGALYDIGFQLSVVCVGSILLIARPLNFIDHRQHPRLFNIVSILLVTLIATFSSWLICAFYFHRFSLMFLPLNLIAVPLLPLFLVLSLVYIVLFSIGVDFVSLGKLLDSIFSGFISLTKKVTGISSTFGGLHPGGESVFLWILGLVLLAYILNRNLRKKLVLIPVSLFVFALISLPLFSERPVNGFILQKNNSARSIMVYDSSGEQQLDIPEGLNVCIQLHGKQILAIHSLEMSNEMLENVKNADIILVSGRQKELPSEFAELVKPSCSIVTHSSMHWRNEKNFIKSAADQNLTVHSLRYDGPLHIF